MAVRTANAEWKGDLEGGSGTLRSESGALDGAYSFASRFQEGDGTNPEELIGAAHAGCFSMALSNELDQAGFTPRRVGTTARVHLGSDDAGPAVTKIELVCEADVPGIDDETFQEIAEGAKEGCPISVALSATPIFLEARLTS